MFDTLGGGFMPPPSFSSKAVAVNLKSLNLAGVALAAIGIVLTGSVHAQDHTVLFSVTDPGVNRAITNWGLDTTWTDANNMRRGLIFMGTNNVNIVRVGFLANAPLTNNDISPAKSPRYKAWQTWLTWPAPTRSGICRTLPARA